MAKKSESSKTKGTQKKRDATLKENPVVEPETVEIKVEDGGDFQLDSFRHSAFYNPREGRVEMHLLSLRDQIVHLDGVNIPFAEGESIWTESSYKFTLDDFKKLASSAGFGVERVWTDERQWFSVQYKARGSYRQLFARCGFSYQRPAKIYKSRSEAKVAEFEEQLEKKS